jgi:hypothetical protein
MIRTDLASFETAEHTAERSAYEDLELALRTVVTVVPRTPPKTSK